MTDPIEREAFEKWATKRWPGWGLVRGQFGKQPEQYLTRSTQLAWESWQAALALPAALRSRDEVGASDTDAMQMELEGYREISAEIFDLCCAVIDGRPDAAAARDSIVKHIEHVRTCRKGSCAVELRLPTAPAGDVVSREAAAAVMDGATCRRYGCHGKAVAAIRALPSARVGGGESYRCVECGALVTDALTHNMWHNQIVARAAAPVAPPIAGAGWGSEAELATAIHEAWKQRGGIPRSKEAIAARIAFSRPPSGEVASACPHECAPLNMLAALLADYDRRMGGTVEPRDSMMLYHTDDCPHDQPKYGQIRAILTAARKEGR